MTPRPVDSTPWLETIDAFIAGDLDGAAAHAFQERLRNDEAARLVYIEYLDLHFELLLGAGGLEPAESAARTASTPRFRTGAAACAAAAAILVLGWALWRNSDRLQLVDRRAPAEAPTVQNETPAPAKAVAARLVRVMGARWTDLDFVPDEGDRLRVGDILDFTGGSVELHFESGARASLIATEGGTARLQLTSANGCRFESGCATFSVPPAARGFTVETVGGRFIDHGTEFGVSADPRGDSQVHVLEGLVEAQTRQPSSPVMLAAGTAVSVDGHGAAATPVAFRPEQFLRPATLAWGIEQFTGSVHPYLVPPPSLDRDAGLDPAVTHLVLEQPDFEVAAGWQNNTANVFDVVAGNKTRVEWFQVDANTRVNSFLFHASPSREGRRDLTGEIRFRRPILAVITETEDLRRAREIFKNPHFQYDDSKGFGLENTVLGGPNDRVDVIELSDDRRTLRYSLNLGPAVDEFRVLVAADDQLIPLPRTGESEGRK
ncbi:MAG TPA: hypothetical protein VM452_13760 [Caulifigura sp.]|jgi:hypothetical protein|nr:hypothetical protein [Caulifigura sp.]